MSDRRPRKKRIDTIEKLAELVVESNIAGLHRRIDQEIDTRKQHDVPYPHRAAS